MQFYERRKSAAILGGLQDFATQHKAAFAKEGESFFCENAGTVRKTIQTIGGHPKNTNSKIAAMYSRLFGGDKGRAAAKATAYKIKRPLERYAKQ